MPRWTIVAAGLLGFAVASARAGEDAGTFFETKVRPVLATACVKCHGPDKASGGLRLDSRAALVEGGDSGPAIVPGDAEGSLLVQAVRHADDALKMPPKESLPAGVVADLAAWVDSGAFWPAPVASEGTIAGERHWAFGPLRSDVPPEDPEGWAAGPIDRFLAARHRERGLRRVGPADRRTLIRRATFDLIGLPPEPERVEAFAADERPDAFERLIDELLASPRYGERWGRYWLDLARYADTAGDNSDYPIPEAYLYRDYVIDAFNADIPYDRFVHEQLAGDILAREGPPGDHARRVIATGFVAQSKRFGTRKLEDVHQIIEDTLNTTGQVVLGLSLRCARCHDHKFDPVPARDYYAMYGVFASTQYPFAGAEEERRPSEFAPLILPGEVKAREASHAERVARKKSEVEQAEASSESGRRFKELEQAIAEAEGRLKAAEGAECGELERILEEWKAERAKAKERLDAELKPLREQLASLEKTSPLEGAPVAYAVREGKPTDAAIQKGGDPRKTGEVVPRGVLGVLDPEGRLEIPEGASGRLELARWLTTGRAGELAARVMVNRIWQHHFGKAIVPTPSDFGLRGTPPTHPELLDWLAREFIAGGWSIKAMHRTIMRSKAYQLASAHEAGSQAIDSGNAEYWRFDRRPLDAEALRDAVLLLGGGLDPARPGPHPFPPKDKWRYTAHHQFKALYESEHRSVYLMVQRLHPHPYLSLFHGPDTSMTTPVRDSAAVPLQALFLVNNGLVHRQAGGFAARLMERESEDRGRVRLAYLMAFARTPSEAEVAAALGFLESYRGALAAEGVAVDRVGSESWAAYARALLASNEFFYVD